MLTSQHLAPVREFETHVASATSPAQDEPHRPANSAIDELDGQSSRRMLHPQGSALHGILDLDAAAGGESSSRPVPGRTVPDSSWLQRNRSQQRRHSTQALAFFANLSSRATQELQQLDRMSRNKFKRQEDGDAAEREQDSGSGSQKSFRPVKSLPAPHAANGSSARPRSTLLRNTSDRTRHAHPRDLPDASPHHEPRLDSTYLVSSDSTIIATHLTSHLTSHQTSRLTSALTTSESHQAAKPHSSYTRHHHAGTSDHSHISRAGMEELLAGAMAGSASMRSLSSSCNEPEPCLATTLELSGDERPGPGPPRPLSYRPPSKNLLSPSTPPLLTAKPVRWPSSTTLSPSSRCDSPASPFAPASAHLHPAPTKPYPPRDPSNPFAFPFPTPTTSISAQSIADIDHVHVKGITEHKARHRWSADHSRVMPVNWVEEEEAAAAAPARGSAHRSLRSALWLGLRSVGHHPHSGAAVAPQAEPLRAVLVIPRQPAAGGGRHACACGAPAPAHCCCGDRAERATAPPAHGRPLSAACVLGAAAAEPNSDSGSSGSCRRLRRSEGVAGQLPPFPLQERIARANAAGDKALQCLVPAPFSSTHLSLLLESLRAPPAP